MILDILELVLIYGCKLDILFFFFFFKYECRYSLPVGLQGPEVYYKIIFLDIDMWSSGREKGKKKKKKVVVLVSMTQNPR